jgi:hypothetical protein
VALPAADVMPYAAPAVAKAQKQDTWTADENELKPKTHTIFSWKIIFFFRFCIAMFD